MSKVFISYDRTSKPLVLTLVKDLEDLGHTVWFDDDLSGGQEWWDHILDKIRDCEVFLFALAPRALKSVACTREFDYADKLGKPIIPVLVRKDVQLDLLPEALSRIQHVDFLNPKDRKALAAVGRALTIVTPATSLPEDLPEPPEMPVSYVAELAKRARQSTLSSEEQSSLLADIETILDDKAYVKDAREILRELKNRSDLLPDPEKGIAELLRRSRPVQPPVLIVVALVLVLGLSGVYGFQVLQERQRIATEQAAEAERQRIEAEQSAENQIQQLLLTQEQLFDLLETTDNPSDLVYGGQVNGFYPTLRHSLSNDERGPEMVGFLGGYEVGPAFIIGRKEITFEQYDEFAEATGREKPDDEGWGRGSRPVINVSWHDATAYADWLSRQTRESYSLPTEAQWIHAASAGSNTNYWWGDSAETGQANCMGCESFWAGRQTAPVGAFSPNPAGLYDTAGNVSEWVQDCYEQSDTTTSNNNTNSGNESCQYHTILGGSWAASPEAMRLDARLYDEPTNRSNQVGFRLAARLRGAK